ncbi:hypothetical protein G210_3299 [Candida maltosa Xu316]|uniref:Uncharacterized protein n=1 Tax=Candida maltosa (strain Xu316) TaxID=1245528 RepID=M3HGQ2_CANMX|nr:hypothetical protein G210_3299 [Candida maltosa Xu316]
MTAMERLAMVQGHMDHTLTAAETFPYLSREERLKYDPDKIYNRTSTISSVRSTSPSLSLSSVSASSSVQLSRSPSPVQLATVPVSLKKDEDEKEEENKDESDFKLNDLVKKLNKKKVLCLSNDKDSLELQQDEKDENIIIHENINEITEDKFTDEYDVVILNELGEESSYETSLFLKSINSEVVIVVRDEFRPESIINDDDNKNCEYDYYVDLNNSVVVKSSPKEEQD